jgi:dolichyl-phosphate-mannose-protein mannosyltransferase
MTSNPANVQARREWLVVLILTAVAAVLRFWRFGTLGLTHFDEGIYATAGTWSLTPRGLAGLDPELIAYAPPGYPILVGLAYTIFGLSDAAPLFVAIVCGIATVPVAGWLGRRTFGAGAGAAAAAFAALAVAHVAFSRKALTDSPFLLAWLAALGLGGRFLERPSWSRAVAFGLAVGVAQNVKYNGYLAGVIVLVTALVALAVDPEARRTRALARTFGWGLLAAVVAGLLYGPWYAFVTSHGGYADLLRHQRSYLGGPETWLPHWRQQLAQVVALSGGTIWSASTWPVAWMAASLAACGTALVATGSRLDWARLRIGLLFGAAVLAGILDAPWWIGAAWLVWLVFDPRPAVRLLGVWWLVLSVLTPFYHPYARLWLPLHAAGWILLAGVVVTCGPFSAATTGVSVALRSLLRRPWFLVCAEVVLACLLLATSHWGNDAPEPFRFVEFFRPTDSLRSAVHDVVVATSLPVAAGASLRVLARRPVAFYLALEGKVPFRLVAGVAALARGPESLNDWALVDDALLPVDQPFRTPSTGPLWYERSAHWSTNLDPVTRLDVVPDSAFINMLGREVDVILLKPAAPIVSPPVPAPTTEPP